MARADTRARLAVDAARVAAAEAGRLCMRAAFAALEAGDVPAAQSWHAMAEAC